MLKNRFIRRRQRSKSADKQTTGHPEILLDPPEQFSNTEADAGSTDPSATDTARLKKDEKKDGDSKLKKSNSSDDYGFLPLSRDCTSRKPRITVRAHSPKSEIDYLDNSLFDIGFLQSAQDSIPVTLGSLSANQADTAADTNSSGDMKTMTAQLPYQSSRHWKESHYVNTELLNTKSYEERPEGHYARLSELKPAGVPTIKPAAKGELNFYVQKAAEQRARSKGRDGRQRSRSRSTHQSEARSRSRGRSASRDIMALYTNRPVSGCRLRNTSSSPKRDSARDPRQQSISPDTKEKNRNGRSKNNTTEITSQKGTLGNVNNLNTIVNKQTSTHKDEFKTDDGASFMTLLEMDEEKTAEIEKKLMAANSLKPANIKMMMIAHHIPSNNWANKDEISVKVGDIVTGFYKQNDWLYIMTVSKERGFVPYAFTKPIKVTNYLKCGDNLKTSRSAVKPVNGILKTSNCNRQKPRKSHPKFSVKVRTAADTESLSSESGSAITEDFVYTRKKSNTPQSYADCIVIDTDDIALGFERRHNGEETSTYCSDSGISDPSSNNSEDIDSLNSPMSATDERSISGFSIHNSTPRLPNERIVSVTTELLAHSPYNSMKSTKSADSRSRYGGSATISDMPLGPLGARLAKLSIESKTESSRKDNILNNDMRERAKCSNATPSSLRLEIPKDYNGPRVTVVYDYEGGNQDDLVVHASDIVTVLNSEDIEWIWAQRRDGKEGFIPREFVIPLELSVQNRRRVGISLL